MLGIKTSNDLGERQRRHARQSRPELLNSSWHGFGTSAAGRRCGACLERLGVDEQVVRRVGDVFHPSCAPHEVRSRIGADAQGR